MEKTKVNTKETTGLNLHNEEDRKPETLHRQKGTVRDNPKEEPHPQGDQNDPTGTTT